MTMHSSTSPTTREILIMMRKKAKLSRRGLADKMNYDQSTLGYHETGEGDIKVEIIDKYQGSAWYSGYARD